jgi:hypothetical protein
VTVFLAYLAMAYGSNNSDMYGIISPLVFTAILAYFVSSIFSEIFGMCIDTILMCYIADEEMFPPENRFADGGLKSSLQEAAEKAAATSKVPPVHFKSIQVDYCTPGFAPLTLLLSMCLFGSIIGCSVSSSRSTGCCSK